MQALARRGYLEKRKKVLKKHLKNFLKRWKKCLTVERNYVKIGRLSRDGTQVNGSLPTQIKN